MTCGYSSCGYTYVFTNLQTIVVHYSLAGGYAVKVNIFVQSNIVFLATVCIQAFGYSNVIALGNSGVFLSKLFNIGYTIIKILDIGLVLSNVCCILIDVSSVSCDICFVLIDISSVSCNVCFVLGYAVIQCCDICFILINIGSVSCNILIGLMQLAAVYSVSGISSDCTCCYAGNLAVFSNSYFTKLSTFSGDLAVVAACIANKQFAVTQCGMTGIYAVLQYYVADFACSCGYFAIFIYYEAAVCTIECAVAVYEERYGAVFICSTYGQVVFCVQCVGLNIVYINVFVQLNLNLSAVMAYADVLVAAEINKITGFYIGCFGCNTVGSKIPAHVSSCTYCLQLTYVYCIIVVNACSYACNTAILVYSYFIVDGCGITKQGNSCAFTIGQFGCCAVQSKACTVIADGFDSSQILIQFNLNSVNTIFCILAYADILVTAEVNIIAGFYIFCFGQNTISSKLPSAVLQLAYVYCIIVVNACSYACNTAILVYGYCIVDSSGITKQFYRCALTISQFGCKTAQCQFSIAIADAFDINQILVQLSLNLSLVIAYADILIAAEINISTGCYINSGSSNTVSGKIPAFICICSYLFDIFQLAYIYSISIMNAFSYVSDYFIVSIQAVFGDVSIAAKTNAFFIIHEVIACLNAVNIKIFVQFNVNKSSIIGFFLAYGNISIVTAEVNDITGFNFSRVGDFFPGGKIPACIFSCSLQLCYVYSIGSFAASCYIGNLTSKGSTAYRYSTGICFPGKAICIFRSKSTNNTGFCCSISN